MRILIAGGTGLLGGALRARLEDEGHTVSIFTRRARPGARNEIAWTPDGSTGPWSRALDGADAVVNLSGEGIADKRWNADRKQALLTSRVLSTRSLATAIRQAPQPPALISGSAVGYYGDRGDELVTEASAPGSDFLATLCMQWEREADQASSITRVAIVRTGLVLDTRGGALAQLLPPFRFGLGGPIGDGKQYMPWIHRDDWVALVMSLLANTQARGPFNATAPHPVSNAEFARTLGRVLSRPAVLPMPGFALRLLVGELAESILTGQRAVPARAEEIGFRFRFGELEPALGDLLAAQQ